jgi:hypothetical protein
MASNPAGVAVIPFPEVSASYTQSILDTHFGSYAFAYPLRHSGLGMIISYYNGGKIESGNTLNAQEDYAVHFLYGYAFSPTFSAGITVKYAQSTLVEHYTASVLAADAGMLWRPYDERFLFAGVINNAGSSLQYYQTAAVTSACSCDRKDRRTSGTTRRPRGLPSDRHMPLLFAESGFLLPSRLASSL